MRSSRRPCVDRWICPRPSLAEPTSAYSDLGTLSRLDAVHRSPSQPLICQNRPAAGASAAAIIGWLAAVQPQRHGPWR